MTQARHPRYRGMDMNTRHVTAHEISTADCANAQAQVWSRSASAGPHWSAAMGGDSSSSAMGGCSAVSAATRTHSDFSKNICTEAS